MSPPIIITQSSLIVIETKQAINLSQYIGFVPLPAVLIRLTRN